MLRMANNQILRSDTTLDCVLYDLARSYGKIVAPEILRYLILQDSLKILLFYKISHEDHRDS